MKNLTLLSLSMLLGTVAVATEAQVNKPVETQDLISLSLNGKPLAGIQQAAFSTVPFARNSVKAGTSYKLTLSLLPKNGKPLDISHSPNTSITDEDGCLVVKGDVLTVNALGRHSSCVAANLYITYTFPNDKQHFVVNIFAMDVTASSPLTGSTGRTASTAAHGD